MPKPGVSFVMRLDTILIGGKPTPVTLVPMDAKGRGVFTFTREKVVLDTNYVSRWRLH